MRFKKFLLFIACCSSVAAVSAHAKTAMSASFPEAQALSTSDTDKAPQWHQLKEQEVELLRKTLGAVPGVDKDQAKPPVDKQWFKASGYDMRIAERQQQGIELLKGFSQLPQSLLDRNLHTVEAIHHASSPAVKRQALVDAYGDYYLYYLAAPMGPKLGSAFLRAYQSGEMSKAAALIEASTISTSVAKKHFNYPRPFLQPGNTITAVKDDIVYRDDRTYTADGGAFPSGHTNSGYTAALLMAEMLPERFEPLVTEGARYGYSRVVLGVHYPLDVMGSRMVVEHHIADMMNDSAWRKQFDEARQQMRSALEKECGMSLTACAQAAPQNDPYTRPDMRAFYRYTMTYGLPKITNAPQKITVPKGAEVLLEAPLPHLSAEQRRQLMASTSIESGYALSDGGENANFWQRLNLVDAIAKAKQQGAGHAHH